MFRRDDSQLGRWTFLVARAALEALAGDAGEANLQAVFNRYRSRIYQAALTRMQVGEPSEQQVLSADEIRDAELDFGDTLIR